MRRALEAITLAALAALGVLTALALVGPRKLPGQIPTHFDASGQATAWSGPQALLGIPIGALVLYLMMTWVSQRPGSFNFPVRTTRQNRARLEALALEMISWLKAEVICLFAWIQNFTIEAARSGRADLPTVFMPITLGIVFVTIGLYFLRFRRAAS